MLHFFRKYEKYFFVLITIVVILSFSFFGTYSTLEKTQYVDPTAFTAIDGSKIKTSTLEEMMVFLGTDQEDKMLFGGAWGPNFLNDGVIKKDFLETGLAQTIVTPYLETLRPDLESRFQKEIKFSPYQNPKASFISAINAWNMMAPEIPYALETLRRTGDPATVDSFDQRVKLFQAQRQLPPHFLRLALRHQERQNPTVSPDPSLDRTDLFIFGYHTVNDWFGPSFERLAASFIINSAIFAEQQGYRVSEAEVMADLYRNAEKSFQQNANNPNLGVATLQQYIDEQLRRMRMDASQAINIWHKVLLFRQLFQDLGNSVLMSPLALQQFDSKAQESLEGDLYQLPKALHIGDLTALQKFELYLNAVSKRPESGAKLLDLPEAFKSPEEVAKVYPELVQKRYLIEFAKIDKRNLQATVGIKETWNWETNEKNWDSLKKKFPELASLPAKTEEERASALETLSTAIKSRIDRFARQEIVNAHPEWIKEALQMAPKEILTLNLHKKGKNPFFPSLKKPEELMDLLDKYPASEESLKAFTPDENLFYQIRVIDRSPTLEILTFAEATNHRTFLSTSLDAYLKAGGEKQVEAVLKEINQYVNRLDPKNSKPMIADYAAAYRLHSFVDSVEKRFQKEKSSIPKYIVSHDHPHEEHKLPPREALKEQWRLERKEYTVTRSNSDGAIPIDELFALEPKMWSKPHVQPNGAISFFQLNERPSITSSADFYENFKQIHRDLALESEKELAQKILDKMQARG